eukprot:jgi/Chlat1/1514/Chrsp12S08683
MLGCTPSPTVTSCFPLRRGDASRSHFQRHKTTHTHRRTTKKQATRWNRQIRRAVIDYAQHANMHSCTCSKEDSQDATSPVGKRASPLKLLKRSGQANGVNARGATAVVCAVALAACLAAAATTRYRAFPFNLFATPAPATPPPPPVVAAAAPVTTPVTVPKPQSPTLRKLLREPIPAVIEADRNQPEFKISFREYINRVVCDLRINEGVENFKQHGDLLKGVETRYGVPADILTALWGVESNYGRVTGDWDVMRALATLAMDTERPRRAAYFKNELIEALMIVEAGHVGTSGVLRGSWAGAMGQPQFMPSSFRAYAVDHDGDGCANIWDSRADVLASIANYLVRNGWQAGQPYAQQVTVPRGLDSALFGLKVDRTIDEWWDLGLRSAIADEELPVSSLKASLVAPDGPSGLAFLVYPNFRAVMRYNSSTYYAASVGQLARAIARG